MSIADLIKRKAQLNEVLSNEEHLFRNNEISFNDFCFRESEIKSELDKTNQQIIKIKQQQFQKQDRLRTKKHQKQLTTPKNQNKQDIKKIWATVALVSIILSLSFITLNNPSITGAVTISEGCITINTTFLNSSIDCINLNNSLNCNNFSVSELNIDNQNNIGVINCNVNITNVNNSNYILIKNNNLMNFTLTNSSNNFIQENMMIQPLNINQNSQNNTFFNNNLSSIQDNTPTSNILMYQNNHGLIYWEKYDLNIIGNFYFGNNLIIDYNNLVIADNQDIKNLHTDAQIQLNNLPYAQTPKLFKDQVRCDNTSDCNVYYNNYTLFAEVTQTGNFTTEFLNHSEVPTLSNLSLTQQPIYTNDNITASIIYQHQNNQTGQVNFGWFVNNVSVLNQFANNISNNQIITSTLTSNNFNKNDYVQVQIQAQNNEGSSNITFSNLIYIQNTPPLEPYLQSPTNNEHIIDRSPLLVWTNQLDADNDNVTYNLILDDNNLFNNPEVNQSISSTNQNNISFQVPLELDVDKTYYWKVISNDGQGSTGSTVSQFTIDSYIDVSLIVDSMVFGTLNSLEVVETDNVNVLPFKMENHGNIPVNISISGTPFFETVPFPSDNHQFKIAENKLGSFDIQQSLMNWTNMSNQSQISVVDLDWHFFKNDFLTHLKVTIPSGEPPGTRISTTHFEVD